MEPKTVEYVNDCQLAIGGEEVEMWLLPRCPTCKHYPTYDMNPCPYCGQELVYPESQVNELYARISYMDWLLIICLVLLFSFNFSVYLMSLTPVKTEVVVLEQEVEEYEEEYEEVIEPWTMFTADEMWEIALTHYPDHDPQDIDFVWAVADLGKGVKRVYWILRPREGN